jgi:hypothetical protein
LPMCDHRRCTREGWCDGVYDELAQEHGSHFAFQKKLICPSDRLRAKKVSAKNMKQKKTIKILNMQRTQNKTKILEILNMQRTQNKKNHRNLKYAKNT